MIYSVTAEDHGMVRIEAAGASATIKFVKDVAHILFIQVPEDQRRQGVGSELISAVEQEASSNGVSKIMCNYSDEACGMNEFMTACGYKSFPDGEIVSFGIGELLASQGVTKSMRIRFKEIQTYSFEELLMFEWTQMSEFLNRYGIEIRDVDFDRFDPSLSCVAYDYDDKLRAMLLSTIYEDCVYVELLFGFSSKKPEFVLCVCQQFARMLTEKSKNEDLSRIHIYTCADFVVKLLKRLLDSKYEIKAEHGVMRAVKEIAPGESSLQRDIGDDDDVWLWHDEAEGLIGQRNISEKVVWLMARR